MASFIHKELQLAFEMFRMDEFRNKKKCKNKQVITTRVLEIKRFIRLISVFFVKPAGRHPTGYELSVAFIQGRWFNYNIFTMCLAIFSGWEQDWLSRVVGWNLGQAIHSDSFPGKTYFRYFSFSVRRFWFGLFRPWLLPLQWPRNQRRR